MAFFKTLEIIMARIQITLVLMANPIDGTDGKLGHGFTSADKLEEIDIGPGDRPRPTYVSAKLDPEYKQELIDLLKEFKNCFA